MKTRTCIYIDEEIMATLKSQNIHLSALVERLLYTHLETDDAEEKELINKRQQLEKQLIELKTRIVITNDLIEQRRKKQQDELVWKHLQKQVLNP